MQKKIALTCAVACFSFLLYWYFLPQPEKDRAPESTKMESPEKEKTPVPEVEPKRVSHEPIAPSKKPLPKNHEPSNVVELHVEEGYAIAHGDIILGEPEDETITSGEYEMPLPEYWDKPEIPFAIDANVPDTKRILTAIKHIETKTGVKFISYEGHKDGILFQKGSEHCLSALGRRGGLQPIKISDKCTWNEITHEIMHSLGFIHEQSRPDRNKYVEVLWQNIEDKYLSQFEMMPYEFMGPSKDFDFDYESIMLYGTEFFVKEPTLQNMTSLTGSQINPSQNGLSLSDIKRVKKLYRLD